MRGQVHE